LPNSPPFSTLHKQGGCAHFSAIVTSSTTLRLSDFQRQAEQYLRARLL
jgi:hypothetical protein